MDSFIKEENRKLNSLSPLEHGSFMTRVAASGRRLVFGPSADCGGSAMQRHGARYSMLLIGGTG